MTLKPLDLTGGKSVYCFNEYQMKRAFEMFAEQSDSGTRVRAEVDRLAEHLNRNELATLAFVLIDRLNKTAGE